MTKNRRTPISRPYKIFWPTCSKDFPLHRSRLGLLWLGYPWWHKTEDFIRNALSPNFMHGISPANLVRWVQRIGWWAIGTLTRDTCITGERSHKNATMNSVTWKSLPHPRLGPWVQRTRNIDLVKHFFTTTWVLVRLFMAHLSLLSKADYPQR